MSPKLQSTHLFTFVFLTCLASSLAWIDPSCMKDRRIKRNHMIQDSIDEVFYVSSIQKARVHGNSKQFNCLNKLYELGNDTNWSKTEEVFEHGNTVFLDDSDWPSSYLELYKDDLKYALMITPSSGGNETTIELTDGEVLRKGDIIHSMEYNVESSEIVCRIERKQYLTFIGVFNILSRTWSTVKSWPSDWSPQEVFWVGEANLMGVASRKDPVKQSRIFMVHRGKTNKFQFLSPANNLVSHPRITPNMKGLLYFESNENGTVIKYNPDIIKNSKLSGDASIVLTDHIISDGKSYGVYPANVPLRAFSSDGSKFYLSVFMESSVHLVAITLDDEADQRVEVFDGTNLRLMDVYEDHLLIAKSNWNEYPKVFVSYVGPKEAEEESHVEFKLVTEDVEVIRERRYGSIKSDHAFMEKFASNYVAASPLRPQMSKNSAIPIIVVLHGGPNSVKTSEYDRLINGLLGSDFAVVSVNYRGSLGMNSESLASIKGYKIKDLMKEVKEGIASAIESSRSLDALRVGIVGIGFGGLLALELSNYHSKFENIVLVNPIVDLPQMRSSSDPQWVYDVLGMNYSYPQLPSMDFFNKSWEMSPLKFSKEYRRDYFMVLSEENKWIIPETQGLMWHRFAGKPNTSRPFIIQDETEENPFLRTLHPKEVKAVMSKMIHYFHDIWENDADHCEVLEQEQVLGQRYASHGVSLSASSLLPALGVLLTLRR